MSAAADAEAALRHVLLALPAEGATRGRIVAAAHARAPGVSRRIVDASLTLMTVTPTEPARISATMAVRVAHGRYAARRPRADRRPADGVLTSFQAVSRAFPPVGFAVDRAVLLDRARRLAPHLAYTTLSAALHDVCGGRPGRPAVGRRVRAGVYVRVSG